MNFLVAQIALPFIQKHVFILFLSLPHFPRTPIMVKRKCLWICNWRKDGEAREKVKRGILCLNKEVKLTGWVSFRNSTLTLKEEQEEFPPLLQKDDRRLSEAVIDTHLHTYTPTQTYCKCTHTLGNTVERLLLSKSWTILCLEKNINLPSLKESALLNHLKPTSDKIGVESHHALTPHRHLTIHCLWWGVGFHGPCKPLFSVVDSGRTEQLHFLMVL